MTAHDVYSYGVVSSSTLYRIGDPFPGPEGYAEIDGIHYMTGGEATNSSIVLARLGVTVKLDGNWLGNDENGARTKGLLAEYNIDTSRLPLRDGITGVEEVVFAAGNTRTIFGTYGHLLEEKAWNVPEEDDILQSKAVCLDPFFAEPALRVAEIAYDAGIPVVTVDCEFDNPLLNRTAAVVIAESFLRDKYGDAELEHVFAEYQAATEGLVIFSFGDAPIWYARRGESARKHEPYSIEPVDTAGGGDSFRAGIVYGFLQGWPDEKTVDHAAAIAAINCTRSPGVLNSPTHDEVREFMSASSAR